jgi:S-adenosylmethionine hydrolase
VSALVTLTTDFGTQDGYVAAMKGVVLSRAPEVRLVDVAHAVAPQDVGEAAYVLLQAAPYFPDGTVHLAVVDPGVGTARRAIAARFRGPAGTHYFVGQDNGLLALLLAGGPYEPDALEAVRVLDRPQHWRTSEPSRTFHGRDVFAPAAAHLALGRPLEALGSALDASDLHPMRWAQPTADEQGIRGWVVHVDRFGNCTTNISRETLRAHRNGRSVRCYIGSAVLKGVRHTYADVDAGEPLLLFGSDGFLEVGVNTGNAAALLSIRKGSAVDLVFSEGRGAARLSTSHPQQA